MIKRKRLGQHYLVDMDVIKEIVRLAEIKQGDRVFEIGSGRGDLTVELAKVTDCLESYEIDSENYRATKERLVHYPSVRLFNRDAFRSDSEFEVLVSSLPYSESSKFVEWLSYHTYQRAVIIVQRDFAEKLMSSPGEENYRAISVISQISSKLRIDRPIPRLSFFPVPKVESVIVSITPNVSLTSENVQLVKRLFSMKRKKLSAALKKLRLPSSSDFGKVMDRRVESMDPDTIYRVVRSISRMK
jgi:16S rRNA (adenine1518-N6/adenine1519-N6)-dimethyltransferase